MSDILTAEQVRETIEKRFDFDVWVPKERWQAIADELNTMLGNEREKELELLVKQLWNLVNHRSGYGYAAALKSIEELGIEVDDE